MQRTEKLNISISPELKECTREIFQGQKLSDAFEDMVRYHLKKKMDDSYSSYIFSKDEYDKYNDGNKSADRMTLLALQEKLCKAELEYLKYTKIKDRLDCEPFDGVNMIYSKK